MKKRFLIAMVGAVSILLAACGSSGGNNPQNSNNGIMTDNKQRQNDNDEKVSDEEPQEGEIEVDLTTQNINDYIDFVSIGKNEENQSNSWILINKQYENGMIYINGNFEIRYEQTFIEYTSQEKTSTINGFDSFESILESIDKPIIKEVSGTITFYKGGKAYFDNNKKARIAEYGSSENGSQSTRAEYFNEYPY